VSLMVESPNAGRKASIETRRDGLVSFMGEPRRTRPPWNYSDGFVVVIISAPLRSTTDRLFAKLVAA